jgi:hypothetical protein
MLFAEIPFLHAGPLVIAAISRSAIDYKRHFTGGGTLK